MRPIGPPRTIRILRFATSMDRHDVEKVRIGTDKILTTSAVLG
jgi:hypothetical protein